MLALQARAHGDSPCSSGRSPPSRGELPGSGCRAQRPHREGSNEVTVTSPGAFTARPRLGWACLKGDGGPSRAVPVLGPDVWMGLGVRVCAGEKGPGWATVAR